MLNPNETNDTIQQQLEVMLFLRNDAVTRYKTLSKSEFNVMRLVAAAKTGKHIAYLYDRSPKTVEKHRSNALKKLGVKTTCEAIRLWVYAGYDLPSHQSMFTSHKVNSFDGSVFQEDNNIPKVNQQVTESNVD